MYYFGARWYSGGQGRFASPDPVFASAAHLTDPQMWNEYSYVRNNPLRFTDPTGLDFYLTCEHDKNNGDTCQEVQNGSRKVWAKPGTGTCEEIDIAGCGLVLLWAVRRSDPFRGARDHRSLAARRRQIEPPTSDEIGIRAGGSLPRLTYATTVESSGAVCLRRILNHLVML